MQLAVFAQRQRGLRLSRGFQRSGSIPLRKLRPEHVQRMLVEKGDATALGLKWEDVDVWARPRLQIRKAAR